MPAETRLGSEKIALYLVTEFAAWTTRQQIAAFLFQIFFFQGMDEPGSVQKSRLRGPQAF